MSLDKAELCDSLLNWLQTYHVPSCGSRQDLSSGVAVAHVLHRIDPSWFNEAWLGRIKEESGTNWRLKVSNLKKILQSVLEYYHDVLGQQVSDKHLPEVTLIGEVGDVTELGKLVQLVLGCAVSCEKKQEHIQQIMTLQESVQHVVMTAIQELLTKDTPEPGSPETYGDFDYQSRKYYFISEEAEEKADLNQRCQDLEHQLSLVQDEKCALQTEARTLKERLSKLQSPDDSSRISNKKLLLLQSQMEHLQEENFRLESSRDDLRARVELVERELTDLQLRNEELTCLAQEAQTLKDEMDVLRHSSDRVGRLEALVESYKRKLEDLGDLRRQVRLLEERNLVYMERTCELEEELRRANTVRGQLEACQRQVHELHAKHSAEAVKAEKWQFEYKNLQDKYDSLHKERERLTLERDALRETNEELKCAQVQQKCLSQADALSSDTVGSLASEIAPAELKEAMSHLQRENHILCVQEESCRQQLQELHTLLEESQRSRHALESQDRQNRQQMCELHCQLEELQNALQQRGGQAEHSSLLKKKLEEHLMKLHEAQSDLQRKKDFIDDLEPRVDGSMARRVDELQERLRKKDEDLREMEQRYKRYVERAQAVSNAADTNVQPIVTSPVTRKNHLTEKNKRIQHLENDYEKTRSRHEQEEKLIISAWYNMGMDLQQKVSSERTGAPGHAQSFLAQQRQFTFSRRSATSRLHGRAEPERGHQV